MTTTSFCVVLLPGLHKRLVQGGIPFAPVVPCTHVVSHKLPSLRLPSVFQHWEELSFCCAKSASIHRLMILLFFSVKSAYCSSMVILTPHFF